MSDGVSGVMSDGVRARSGDLNLAVHDLGGPDDGRPVLLCHATGFHGRIWAPVAQRLAAAGHRVWALDFRGHGDSDAPDIAYEWEGFGEDVLAVVDELGLSGRHDLAGAGHSKGAAALVLAEDARPGTFDRLWLYEPIIFPMDPPPGPSEGNPLSEGARRRRMVWDSPEQAYENFASKPPLDALAPEVLRAYVEGGMRPREDGTWELKCRGEIEARVYAMGSAHTAFRRLSAVQARALVLCGERTNAIPAEFGQNFAERMPDARFRLAEGKGHFGPLEDPDWTAASIDGWIREADHG